MRSPFRLPAAAFAAAFFVATGLSQPLRAQAPAITATKTDSTPAATRKAPGSTITYTNTISNGAGAGTATGVAFTDPDGTGATVVANSIKVSPVALNDAYSGTIVSGVGIDTTLATNFSVTANDYVGINAGAAGVLTITAFDATSAGGGTVTMVTSGANVGKFTYVSAGGFTGADTFTYTVGNGSGLTSTATVSLTVSGAPLWFVSTTGNDTTGNGTLARPYQTLAKVATVDGTGHRVFVSSGAYAAGMSMESNEQIIGQGVVGTNFDAEVAGVTAGADSAARPLINGTKPTITASSGNVIILGSGNIIRGVTVNSTVAGYAVVGGSSNGLQLGSAAQGTPAADTTVNSTGASSGCLSLTGAASGTINVTAQLTATVGRSVNITGRTGGTVSLIGKVTDNGSGVLLSGNTGATFNFRCLVLSTGANTAFSAAGGGTLNITSGVSDGIDNDGDGTADESDEANTIATTTGTALNVAGTTIGASNLTFRSISSNGGSATGIILDTTGSSGGLRVVGNGSAGSGGTIANKTGSDGQTSSGIGIYLNSTAGVQLDRMILQNFQNYAIRGLNVAGFTLANSTINATSGLNGTSTAVDEGSVVFGVRAGTTGLTGTASITNTAIEDGVEDSVGIYNASGTLTLTIDNTPVSGSGNDGIAVELHSTANTTVEVKNSALSANAGDHFQATANGSAVLNVLFGTNGANNLTGGHAAPLGQSLVIQTGGQWSGTGTFNISNNSINNAVDTPININAGGPGTLTGTIHNNTIGTSNVDNTGTINNEDAIRIVANGDKGALGANAHGGTLTVSITNNTLQQADSRGIYVAARDGGSTTDPIELNVTIQGNLLRQPSPADPPNSFAQAIYMESGTSSSPTPDRVRLHANIGGAGALANVIQGDWGPAGGDEIRLRHQFSATSDFVLSGLGADTSTTSTVVSYLLGRNTIDAGRNMSATIAGGGTYKTGGAAPLPLLFAPAEVESLSAAEPDSVYSAIAWTEAVRQSMSRAQPPVVNDTATGGLPSREAPAALTQAQLDVIVSAARTRWQTAGLTPQQQALLNSLTFEVADLPGWYLGENKTTHIRIDTDAGGNHWFIDTTPADDSEFSSEASALSSSPSAPVADRIDLLTTVLHEMGHSLGLCDTYSKLRRNSVMYGFLTKGERRLPMQGQAMGAIPHEHATPHYLSGSISIGTLPPGKTVTIVYDVTISDPPPAGSISSQGTVSGGNFSDVLTDDPDVAGATNPTVTLVDLPDVNVAITGATSRLENSGGNLVYTFTRQGGTTSDLSVNFAVTGTATYANTDYGVTLGGSFTVGPSNITGTIIIPTGQSSASLTLSPVGDTAVEPDETLTVTVTSGTAYDVGATADATGTITNDDTGISIDTLPDTSLFEDQTLNFSYTFRRSGVTTGTTTANFTVGGAAAFSTDYTQSGATTFTTTTGTVVFAPGETTKVVTLDPVNDNLVEGNETIILTVATGTGYTAVSATSQTATIVDDDVTVTVAASPVPASVLEDSGTGMVYTFTRSGGSVSNALTVHVAISGTATFNITPALSDYSATGFASNNGTAATITFAGGSATKTVTITPTADTTSEPDETVILTVGANGTPAVTGGYAVGSPSVATGTLTDDDLPQVSVSTTATAGDNDAAEGGSNNGLYTFTRNQTTGALTVNFQLDASSTAVAGTDFELTGATSFINGTGAGTVSFANGVATATVTLTALTESPNGAEAAETARLNVVASPGVYVAGASPNATVTINANSFLVTTTADSGTGSLRQAVLNANAIAGDDVITFDPTAFATAQVISLTSGHLLLNSNVNITGPGANLLTVRNGAGAGAENRVFRLESTFVSTIRGITIADGRAGFSAGIDVLGSGGAPTTLNLISCTVTGNTSSSYAGGVAGGPGSVVNIINSTISGNTANGGGGTSAGIDFGGATLRVINSTISGNSTPNGNGNGGGIAVYGGTVTIVNSTITNNLAAGASSGGGVFVFGNGLISSTVTVGNSVIAGNQNNGTVPDVSKSAVAAATLTSSGGNVVGNRGSVTAFNQTGDTAGTSAAVVNPLLAALSISNGGTTATHALQSGSPALNIGLAGNLPVDTYDLDGDSDFGEALPVDQRGVGFIRSIGAPDAGAFELQKSVSIVADVASKLEGSSGATNFTFTVSRTGGTTGAVNMTYTVSGAAVTGADFVGGTLPTGTVTITDTNSSATVTIPVSGDTTTESNEAFTVTLSSPDNGYVIVGSTATSTITNDDSDIAVTVSPASVTENSGSALTYTFTRTGYTGNAVTANFAVGGTAALGGSAPANDFTTTGFSASTGSIDFAISDTTKSFTVTPVGDTIDEDDETVVLTMASGTAYNVSGSPATGTITDDDAAPIVSINTPSAVTEGDSGTKTIGFTVSLNAASGKTVTVNYATANGTATIAGGDYVAASNTVTFTAGATTQTVNVTINGDTLNEVNETFTVTLTSPSNATLGTATGTGTITNDDAVPTLSINDVTQAEGDSGTTSFVFTVSLSTASGQTVTVNYATADGTAIQPGDYASASSSLTFSPGTISQTLSVSVNGNTTWEPDESFLVNLTGPTNATLADGQGLGTITNDDLPQVSVSTTATAGDNDAAEGGVNNGLYTFTRDSTTGPLTLNFQLDASSTAVAGTDFELTGATSFINGTGAGTVSFANGVATATVTLTALTESPNGAEAAETARLNVVASPGVYAAGASPNATVTINANSFLVTTTADSGTGSLRQAVLNANAIAGTDTITFNAATFATAQVITLTTGEISLASTLTIQGPGAALLTISGGNTSRMFNASSGTATLTGLRLSGGNGAGATQGNGAGGAIHLQFANVILRDCVVTGNTATTSGGGIFCSDPSASLTLINCTVSGNTAGAAGGGVWLFGSPGNVHRIIGSTISDNTAGTIGGGVGIVGTDTSIINSTISGNNTGSHGGGVYVDGLGTLLLSSTTITGNRADVNPDATVGKGGGLCLAASNTETLNNTIVAGNLSGASPSTTPSDIDWTLSAQTVNTASNNVIGNAGTAGGITNGTGGNIVGNAGSGTLAIASILNTTLANNGGSTATHALVPGSAALNAGNSALLPLDVLDVDGDGAGETLDVDQRGATFLRSIGVTDIGAFELQKAVSIVADAGSKAEGTGGTTNFTFTVSRTGGTTGAVTMTYTVSGAAVVNVDFIGDVLPTGTATIADGSSSTSVTIPVKADALVEPNEAFTVTLSAPDNGYVVSGTAATSTINDDDTGTVAIAKLTDGVEGTTNAVFRLTQTSVSSTNTVVNIAATGASTATSGSDYTALGLTATIPAGQTLADITVAITDDRQVEGAESLGITLGSINSANTGIMLGATVTDTASIADNDTATIGFTSGTGTALESAGTQNVGTTLTLNTTGSGTIGLASNLTANLTATGGGATGSGTDYTLPGSPAVTFLAGTYASGSGTQNGVVSITDDRLVEGSETAGLGLNIVTNIGTQVTVGGTTAHTLTLTDNDTATLGFTSGTGTALESAGTQNVGTTLTFNITGSGTIGLASNLTANLTTTGGGATGSGMDYTLPGSPAVTFPAGTYATGTATQNGVVSITDDRLVEGSETAVLGLSIAGNIGTQVSVGGTTSHTLTITDNDTATLGFTSGTGNVLEGQAASVGTTLTITATGTGTIGLGGNLTADVTTSAGGTATGSGTDYTLPASPAVTYAAGSYASGTATQNATVTTVDDRLGESPETANLGLSLVANLGTQVTIAGTTAHTLTIGDNDIVSIGFTAATGAALESAGTQNVNMTLTLVMFGTGPIGLAYDVSGNLNSTGGPGTATGSGTDYTLPASPAVTFAAGAYPTATATQNASVAITDDRLIEGAETVAFGVTSTWGITGPTMSHTLTITDNDTATIGFTSGTGTAPESGGTQNVGTTLTINATGTGTIGLASNVTADLTTTAGGTAQGSGTDYTLPASPAVTFAAGTYASGIATQNGVVSLTDDRQVEGSETAALGLSIAGNIGTQVSIGGTTAHTLTLTDNDTATLGFSSGTSTVLESAGSQSVGTTLVITATGTGTIGLASNLTANLTTTGGTASGTDYTLPGSPALTYAAGSYASGTATQSASVTIVNDSIVETNETAALGLSIVTNIGTQGSIGGTTGHTLTITDNDTSVVTLSPVSLSQNEGTGGASTSFTFTTTLGNAVQGGFTLGYTTNNGTALAGSDYTDNDGTLTFAGTAGETQTITVAVTHDGTNELDETFTVALGAFSGTTLGSSLSTAGTPATGTILNDDVVTLSLVATDVTADENTAATGTWRISRNGVVGTTTAQIEIEAINTTAVAADWTQSGASLASRAGGSTGTAVIPDGVSFVDIVLTPSADIHAEANEFVTLKLNTNAAYSIGIPFGMIIINANDFVVINSNDAGEGTLRQAVANANSAVSNDVITFDTPQNVVLTTGELVIQNNGTLAINGGGSTSISGNLASRVFNIVSGAQLTLRGLWIKDGRAGSDGGAIYNAGVLDVISSTLSGNAVTAPLASGGAIFNNAGIVGVVNSTLSTNAATANGGAIHNSTGVVSVVNSTISTNGAGAQGGGLFNDNGSMTVDSSTVTNNNAANGGGGLYRTGGNLSLYNSIIANNAATTGAPDLFAAAVFDDNNNLVGINTGHPVAHGTRGNLVGTAVTPLNPLLGPLANNGGPTLTHALLDGSPAINAGDTASLPVDSYDVDGNTNTAETLSVDQRGAAFPRVIGSIVDIGAYEAFAFRPAIIATTVDEDTLSSTGLAITPNTADGGLTTAFKITNIQNGTLYKNNGSTVITAGTFLTLTEGAAGLKFKPALNLNSPATTFGFDAQATVDGADSGLRTGVATASITVTPVNDAPTVVAPGLADQTLTVGDTRSVALPAAFTDVEGTVLTYTVFSNSDSGKATAAINGNNVDLVAVAAGVTNITIQASDGSVGGTVTDTFQVAVGTVNPTPTPLPPPPGPGGYPISGQTGTYNINTSVTNTTAFPIMGFRLTVDYSAHLAAFPSLRLFNSTSAPGVHPAYIDYPFPVAVGATVPIRLDFYTATRTFPNPFTPVLTVTSLPVSQPSTAVPGPGVPATIRVNAGGQILLEWNSTPGQWYEIRWSDNMAEWYTSTIPIRAAANKAQWIDSGAPFTRDAPGAQRFYIVNPRAAPTP